MFKRLSLVNYIQHMYDDNKQWPWYVCVFQLLFSSGCFGATFIRRHLFSPTTYFHWGWNTVVKMYFISSDWKGVVYRSHRTQHVEFCTVYAVIYKYTTIICMINKYIYCGTNVEHGDVTHIVTLASLMSNTDRNPQKVQDSKVYGPTWGPPGSCRPHMCPMLAPWTLLWGVIPTCTWTTLLCKNHRSSIYQKTVTAHPRNSID